MKTRPLQFARCSSKMAKGWTGESADWPELVDLLTRHDIRQEKDGPLWSPVSIRESSHRKAEAVEAVHLLVLDFDCGKTIEEVLPPLAGLEMVVHSSHSHMLPSEGEKPKFRVVVPLTKPVPGDLWKAWWVAFVAEHAPDCDPACKNANRIYYLPSHPEETFMDALSLHTPGEWLDPAPWMPSQELAQAIPEKQTGAKPTGKGNYATLNVLMWAEATGLKPRPEGHGEGKIFVDCPWKNEHSNGFQGPFDTYLLNKFDGGKPVFKCSHSHCQGRGFWDILNAVGDADRFCRERFEPVPQPQPMPALPPQDVGTGPGLQDATPEEIGKAVQSIAAMGVEWDPVDGHGNPKCGVANALRFLRAVFQGKTIRYNELSRLIEVDGSAMDETAMAKLRERLEIVSGQTKWSTNHLEQGMQILASEVPTYHPVREYLNELVWDGVDRIADLVLGTLAVVSPLQIHQRYMETWFISAVARALKPGCKVDTALILQGPQGARKSSFFRYLVPVDSWFSDDMGSLDNKDSSMAVGGCWIIEWAELESMRRSNVGSVKAFLTRQVDKFRPPYGRAMIEVPRSSVIVGSTNEEQFLHDSTGSRRHMVIPVQHIDTDVIARDRDQLWAEAVYRYRKGEVWYLNSEEMAEQTAVNAELTSEDPWESTLETWLATPEGANFATSFGYYVTLTKVLADCLAVPTERQSRVYQMRVAQILASLGWKRKQWVRDGARQWVYAAPDRFKQSRAEW